MTTETKISREQQILRRSEGAYGGNYGCCPVCGYSEGPFNLHKENWFVCTEHRLRWCASYNVFDNLDGEAEAADIMERFLAKYREIPPMEADLSNEESKVERMLPLGQTVITPAAQNAVHPEDVQASLTRHSHGDWGDCNPEDARENDLAMVQGFRLFSVYHDRNGTKFWIITEADRSATTILLPDDY